MIEVTKELLNRNKNTNFYNSYLRRDIKNKSIENCKINQTGYIGNRPEDCKDDSWALDVYTEDNFVKTCYLYTSEFEYKSDVDSLLI